MAHKEIVRQEERSLAAWDPVREFRAMTGFSDIFEDLFTGFPRMLMPALPGRWTPKVNIKETDKEYVITAALPGVRKEDVRINVQDGVLTIAGEQGEEREEKGKGYLRQEMSYGSFQRCFVLPAGVHPEDVKASQKDGILTVTLPKPAQARSRAIDIKVE